MKLLLDENLPHALRYELLPHEAFTTAYQGWDGIKNGKLLALAAASGFDALLTLDDGIAYQQNNRTLPLAVVILSPRTGRRQDVVALAPAILAALNAFTPKQIVRVGKLRDGLELVGRVSTRHGHSNEIRIRSKLNAIAFPQPRRSACR